MRLVITRERALKFLKAIGYKTAVDWDNNQITKKLLNISEMIEGVELEKFPMKKLLTKIIKADSIRIKSDIDDSSKLESKEMAKKKKGKKKKKAIEGAIVDKIVISVDEETEEVDKEDGGLPQKGFPTKKKDKKGKKDKSTKKDKKNRLTLTVEAILKAKKKASIKELATQIDDRFVAGGGKSNVVSSESTLKTCIKILEIAEVVDSANFKK